MSDRRKLNEIVSDIESTLWVIDGYEGVIDDEMDKRLDALEGEFSDKANAILHVIEDGTAKAEVLQLRGNALREDAKKMTSDMNRLKDWLKGSMEKLKIKSCDLPDFPRLKIKKNPPAVVIDEDLAILGQYIVRTTVETFDKKLIKKDIQNGEKVPGAHLEQKEKLIW